MDTSRPSVALRLDTAPLEQAHRTAPVPDVGRFASNNIRLERATRPYDNMGERSGWNALNAANLGGLRSHSRLAERKAHPKHSFLCFIRDNHLPFQPVRITRRQISEAMPSHRDRLQSHIIPRRANGPLVIHNELAVHDCEEVSGACHVRPFLSGGSARISQPPRSLG